MTRSRTTAIAWYAGALLGPIAVSLALIPARDWLGTANVALILVLVVVVIAACGRRGAALVAAASAALSFNVVHTEPYGSFAIAHREEAVTFVCLVLVGAGVAAVATWGRHHRTTAERTVSDVAVLRTMAELAASGEDVDHLTIAAAFWLRDLLELADCRLEHDVTPTDRARLTPEGEIVIGTLRWDVEHAGLPAADIELVVRAAGTPQARFVLTPVAGARVRPDRLLTAVAVADVLGVCLAADRSIQPAEGGPNPPASGGQSTRSGA